MEGRAELRKKIGNYILEREIGKGMFGSVYLGSSISPDLQDIKLAIKAISKRNLNQHQIERVNEEKENLLKID